MAEHFQDEEEKVSNNKVKIIIAIVVVLVVIAGGVGLALTMGKGNEENTENTASQGGETNNEPAQPAELKIVDPNSKSRPYAVMINNAAAARPHCGLQDAYLVYEICAEGGVTRMLALFKDKDTAKIGSIRSSRHYYLDYANENDAIYIHWGGSPQAYSELGSIDSIDGIAYEGSVFFRDNTLNRAYEHTGFTSMANVKEKAESLGYTRDTNKPLLLNYSVEDVDMASKEGAKTANSVSIRYSYYQTSQYEYDAENKTYKRSINGEPNTDLVTGDQYTVKNIIVYQVTQNVISGDDKGRIDLHNIGSGDGYFISGGYAVPITWEKTGRKDQTVYKYKNGEEIVVNDGNTFIQICPDESGISIE